MKNKKEFNDLVEMFDKHIRVIKSDYPEDKEERVKYVKALCAVLHLLFVNDEEYD
jgi:hypothetical protein